MAKLLIPLKHYKMETEKILDLAILSLFRKSSNGDGYYYTSNEKTYTMTGELFSQVKRGEVASIVFTESHAKGSKYITQDGEEKERKNATWTVVATGIEAPMRELNLETRRNELIVRNLEASHKILVLRQTQKAELEALGIKVSE